jgi:cell division protein YceG involved in septum cleavage
MFKNKPMKKLIILIVALGVLGGLGWYTMNLMNNKGKSDTELIEFSIADTASVDKIIITELVKHGLNQLETVSRYQM